MSILSAAKRNHGKYREKGSEGKVTELDEVRLDCEIE
jgi:hypothetical protein